MIIADEPVSMLDASVRVEILNLLRSIQQARNLTLAFITHDLSTVRHFAERIFVMYAGKIIEQSQVDDLLEHPQHPYTEALLAAIADPDPDNAGRQRAVPGGEPPSLLHPPPGCRFHPRCPHGAWRASAMSRSRPCSSRAPGIIPPAGCTIPAIPDREEEGDETARVGRSRHAGRAGAVARHGHPAGRAEPGACRSSAMRRSVPA
jgi:oligopeptide/dipeptide ABC transporter ATP-binding protein